MFEQFINNCFDDAIKLKEQFKITEKKPWTALTVTNEIIVQLGHYSFIICNSEYTEEKGRIIINPQDELADILLQFCTLCNKLSIRKEKLISFKVEINSISNAILMLNVLIGQITECIMEQEEYRHDKNRIGYVTKHDFVLDRINRCFSIIFWISEKQNYDMIDEFYKMEANAMAFLEGYNGGK